MNLSSLFKKLIVVKDSYRNEGRGSSGLNS